MELSQPSQRSSLSFLTSPGAVAVYSAGYQYLTKGRKRMRVLRDDVDTGGGGQDDGIRRTYARPVVAGRKKFRLAKLLQSGVIPVTQQLGWRDLASPYNWVSKHLVSEYNPSIPGFCPLQNNTTTSLLPMHCIDLNQFIGDKIDNAANYPEKATTQNTDINARYWSWATSNMWTGSIVASNAQTARWYINDPRTNEVNDQPPGKIYRKSIEINYLLYGTKKMPTEFDIRVIRITDPKMCPDYEHSLTSGSDELKEFQQNWQNLSRAWTINPVLRGVEPGPKPVKQWFQTIAKKRVMIGEQTSSLESVPTVQGKMYVRLNEVNNYAWTMTDFDVQSGAATYDSVPNVELTDKGENDGFKYKPYYTSRYYLLVRALAPVTVTDAATGEEGTAEHPKFNYTTGLYDYTPSMDLAIKTHFLMLQAQ